MDDHHRHNPTLDTTSFEKLVQQGWEMDFSGWDFSYVSARMIETPPPWDYRQIVWDRSRLIQSMLDIGTGGGEFLSSLQPFPPETWATEAYPPNISIAQACLGPLGVLVLGVNEADALPFPANQLDLIINRHAGYQPVEIFRVLKPGGSFITQQVGGTNCLRLNQLLQDKVEFTYAYWTLNYAVQELQAVGFKIIDQREAFPKTIFLDIAAVVYFLKIISWQIAGFTPDKYQKQLEIIHDLIQETGGLVVYEHRFFIECIKE